MPPGDAPPSTADNDQSQGGSDNRKAAAAKPPEHGLKCPRCDSPNTKFCYYNNYSLTQPRHFCKTCRRYWTKGGALRNVPIGGGCRKNKRSSGKLPSSSSTTSSRSSLSCDSGGGGGGASPSELLGGGLKFLHSLSPPMDFHLGGLLPLPTRMQQHNPSLLAATGFYNQFSSNSFGDVSSSSAAAAAAATSGFQLQQLEYPLSGGGSSSSLINGLNYPFGGGAVVQGMNNNSVSGHGGLASSIESLSSLNQDLHWKLQQQRLAMLVGGDNAAHKEDDDNNNNGGVLFSPVNLESQGQQRLQPILFENLEISKAQSAFPVGGGSRKDGQSGGDTPTEWFFGNSYGSVAPTPTTTSSGGGAGNGHDNNNNASNNWGGGGGGWGDVQQQPYSALP